MIRIIAGGKKNQGEYLGLISEYEKRLRRPFSVSWEFFEEEKLAKKLEDWPFSGADFVICCDERGENISSPEFSEILQKNFLDSREIIILIGGAYGFSDSIREKADFVWSFSRLVFPHMIARLIAIEQIYRASQISSGGAYHHE